MPQKPLGMRLSLAIVAVVALLASESLCQRKATRVYVGCFVDYALPNRDMLGLFGIAQLGPFSVTYMLNGFVRRSDMTVYLCIEICTYDGFRYSAVQGINYCACDSSYGSWGPAPESECMYQCAGNASQVCGGSYRNSVYENVYSTIPRSLHFRKLAAAAAPPLVTTAEFAGSLGWDVKTQSLMQCAASCARSASCSSYRFNSSSGLCRLSRFATAFANETGDVWIVG